MPEVSRRGVFLSYRRDDAGPYARTLQVQLSERIPDASIFMDLDSIEPGLDFAEVIEEAVNSSAVLVALIGRQWATLTDEDGARRLDNPDDYVRFEVKTALERGVRVIPVLIDGAKPLRQQELPAELHKLARLNAHKLSWDRYQDDASRLLDVIQRVLAAIGDQQEADRKAQEEADREAQEEAGREAQEEAGREAQEEAGRKAQEEAGRKAQEEADRKAQEEADREAQEEADREAQEEAGREAQEEAGREAQEEAERLRQGPMTASERLQTALVTGGLVSPDQTEARRQAREAAEASAREQGSEQAERQSARPSFSGGNGGTWADLKVSDQAKRRAARASYRVRKASGWAVGRQPEPEAVDWADLKAPEQLSFPS